MSAREISVGIAGVGTVGGGVLAILHRHATDIEARLGAKLVVRRLAVRDLAKSRPVELDRSRLTARALDLAEDPAIEVVVELMGGTTHAYELVRAALAAGKHVVTANKALLAARGEELFRLAREKGVDVYYEGAVCGGIPIIRTLREALASDRINAIRGIVNGTTNFILTAMSAGERAFADALAEAQRLGYAEADPTLDVGGGDAAQKLCILAQLAFGAKIAPEQVLTEGIAALEPADFEWAARNGWALKLLAIARRCTDSADVERIEARVHPALVPAGSLLAGVRGAFNAVLLDSEALGPSMLYGQGAGALPTGSAVVADIIDLSRNVLAGSPGRVPLPPATPRVTLRSHDQIRCGYYLRFSVRDEPGVLARIATALGLRRISIAAVEQREHGQGAGPVPVVIVTHEAGEADVRDAIREIDAYPSTSASTRLIRIEGA